MNNKYAEPKALLRNDLTLITMSFVYDVANSVMIDRQSYIDKINKLLGRNICGIRHILFPDNVDETNIYIERIGNTYLLGSVLDHKAEINYERINEFVDIYLEDTANG